MQWLIGLLIEIDTELGCWDGRAACLGLVELHRMHGQGVSMCGEQPWRKARRHGGAAAVFGGHERRRHTLDGPISLRVVETNVFIIAITHTFLRAVSPLVYASVRVHVLPHCPAAWCHGTARRPDKKELGLPTA